MKLTLLKLHTDKKQHRFGRWIKEAIHKFAKKTKTIQELPTRSCKDPKALAMAYTD